MDDSLPFINVSLILIDTTFWTKVIANGYCQKCCTRASETVAAALVGTVGQLPCSSCPAVQLFHCQFVRPSSVFVSVSGVKIVRFGIDFDFDFACIWCVSASGPTRESCHWNRPMVMSIGFSYGWNCDSDYTYLLAMAMCACVSWC